MKGNQRRSQLWRAARLTAVSLVAVGATGPACLSRPLEPLDARTTSTVNEKLTQSSVDKIDILLAIDNSRSMADKQAILNAAVPDLVEGLVNPKCVNPDTGETLPKDQQPTDPTAKCPGTSQRDFPPVLDIHIGIVSSSLGDHGLNSSCPDMGAPGDCSNGGTNYSNNDRGHLITRTDPCSAAVAPTYQNLGFLAWDPKGTAEYNGQKAPGEANLGNLTKTITDLVSGTGQVGCGFEAQNEAWYRFLADPSPYKTITIEGNKAVPHDRDDELLKERADFLRPDSLLAIIMLTDENDCSMREGGSYWIAARTGVHMAKATSVCATNPNDKCCHSCLQAPPSGCQADPVCDGTPTPSLSDAEDPANLRCFNNKQRFGIDFLYPPQRYVNALVQSSLNTARSDLADDGKNTSVPNPIYSDLNPNDKFSTIRDPGLVFLAGIVGVPWQDIAKDPNDLAQGYLTPSELEKPDANGVSGWAKILGDPSGGGDNQPPIPPADPHMIESTTPRPGLPGIDAAADADPIHGHEYTTSPIIGDLEYACIFDLLQAKDCTKEDCDCDGSPEAKTNPLCEPDPNNGGEYTRQVRAKAYPGVRHLQILRGLGDQGIVASVCAKQVDNPGADDYGYRPAILSIIKRLKTKLGGQCLPRTLTVDKTGSVPCVIIEARRTPEGEQCSCQLEGRHDVTDDHKQAEEAAKDDELNPKDAPWNCFCELTQLTSGAEKQACQFDTSEDKSVTADGQPVNGWCYVDPGAGAGDAKLVDHCDATQKREIRFVGEHGGAQPGATLFITCSGDTAK